jgi:hypothetical protein
MFYRRITLSLFIVLVGFAFNQQGLGQYDGPPHQRVQSKCPHGNHRERCYQCNIKVDAFDNDRNAGKEIRYKSPRLSGRGGRAMAALAALTAIPILFADHAEIVGLGFGAIIVILFFLGIMSGYFEDGVDDATSTDEPPAEDSPLVDIPLDFDD